MLLISSLLNHFHRVIHCKLIWLNHEGKMDKTTAERFGDRLNKEKAASIIDITWKNDNFS
jgi:hypothetical protein